MKNKNISSFSEENIVKKQFELSIRKQNKINSFFGQTNKLLMYLFLCFWVIISLFPFFWSLFSSFKNPFLIDQIGLNPFPGMSNNPNDNWTLDNYNQLFSSGPMSRYSTLWIINTIFYSFFSSLLNSILNVLGGYALARIAMKGKNVVIFYFLASILVPSQATFIPTYYIFSSVGIISRDINDFMFILAITFSGMANIIMTFMARQFFLTQSPELEQAARVEGYSPLGIFFTVTLRKMLPLVSTQFVLVFMGSWNNFMTFQLYSGGIFTRMTLSSGVMTTIQSSLNPELGYAQALCLSNISFIPMMLLYYFSLRIQLRGIRGGNK